MKNTRKKIRSFTQKLGILFILFLIVHLPTCICQVTGFENIQSVQWDSSALKAYKDKIVALSNQDINSSIEVLEELLVILESDKTFPNRNLLLMEKHWFLKYLANCYHDKKHFEKAIEYYKRAIKEAKRNSQESVRRYEIELIDAESYNSSSNPILAYKQLLLQIDTTLDLASRQDYFMVRYNLAKCYISQNGSDKATEILIELLDFRYPEILKDKKYGIILALSTIFNRAKNYDLSKKYLLEGLGDESLVGLRRGQLAVSLLKIFKNQEQYDSIYAFVPKVLGIKGISTRSQADVHMVLGQTYIELKRFKPANENLEKALKLMEGSNDSIFILDLKMQLGDVNTNLGNFDQADSYFKEAYNFIDRNPKFFNLSDKSWIMEMDLKNRLAQKGDQSLRFDFSAYVDMRDSMSVLEAESQITEMSTKYESDKKELENQNLKEKERLQADNLQKQRLMIGLALLGLLLLSILALLLLKSNRAKKESNRLLSEQKEAIEDQNQTLQTQTEKIELLNYELSHRVKNNLAFVSSLMDMQVRRQDSQEAKDALKEGRSRIEAMSLVHRMLHNKSNQLEISLNDYIIEMCQNLAGTFPFVGKEPKIEVRVDAIQIDGEMAVRLGLIINELVTNSFKHAFADTPDPSIKIDVKTLEKDTIKLSYRDNGSGLPVTFDIEKTKSLGLKLIHTLTKQLNGHIEINSKQGAQYTIQFNHKKLAS